METGTSLTEHLSIAEMKARYDAAAKRILANKEILAWILKDCVEEYKNCSVKEIAERYIEREPEISSTAVNADAPDRAAGESVAGMATEDVTIREGTVYYDIRFFASAPDGDGFIKLIINVEAQNDYYPGYSLVTRAMYYCARMLSAQNGTDFVPPHYDNIKKVYSIWICSRPPKERQRTIRRYSVGEEMLFGEGYREERRRYDLLSVVMVNLGGDPVDASDMMLCLLETVLSERLPTDEKIAVMQERFGISMTRKLEGDVSSMCNLSEGVWKDAMQKGMEEGMQKGMEEGMQKGMEEGMQKGIKVGMLFSIKNLMENLHFTAEQAMNALQISEEEKPVFRQMLDIS